MASRLATVRTALEVSVGNIRSLGPARALDGIPYAPYQRWLQLIRDALEELNRVDTRRRNGRPA
jgi:hypothetical protein